MPDPTHRLLPAEYFLVGNCVSSGHVLQLSEYKETAEVVRRAVMGVEEVAGMLESSHSTVRSWDSEDTLSKSVVQIVSGREIREDVEGFPQCSARMFRRVLSGIRYRNRAVRATVVTASFVVVISNTFLRTKISVFYDDFVKMTEFCGEKVGWYFGTGCRGLGYYRDVKKQLKVAYVGNRRNRVMKLSIQPPVDEEEEEEDDNEEEIAEEEKKDDSTIRPVLERWNKSSMCLRSPKAVPKTSFKQENDLITENDNFLPSELHYKHVKETIDLAEVDIWLEPIVTRLGHSIPSEFRDSLTGVIMQNPVTFEERNYNLDSIKKLFHKAEDDLTERTEYVLYHKLRETDVGEDIMLLSMGGKSKVKTTHLKRHNVLRRMIHTWRKNWTKFLAENDRVRHDAGEVAVAVIGDVLEKVATRVKHKKWRKMFAQNDQPEPCNIQWDEQRLQITQSDVEWTQRCARRQQTTQNSIFKMVRDCVLLQKVITNLLTHPSVISPMDPLTIPNLAPRRVWHGYAMLREFFLIPDSCPDYLVRLQLPMLRNRIQKISETWRVLTPRILNEAEADDADSFTSETTHVEVEPPPYLDITVGDEDEGFVVSREATPEPVAHRTVPYPMTMTNIKTVKKRIEEWREDNKAAVERRCKRVVHNTHRPSWYSKTGVAAPGMGESPFDKWDVVATDYDGGITYSLFLLMRSLGWEGHVKQPRRVLHVIGVCAVVCIVVGATSTGPVYTLVARPPPRRKKTIQSKRLKLRPRFPPCRSTYTEKSIVMKPHIQDEALPALC